MDFVIFVALLAKDRKSIYKRKGERRRNFFGKANQAAARLIDNLSMTMIDYFLTQLLGEQENF